MRRLWQPAPDPDGPARMGTWPASPVARTADLDAAVLGAARSLPDTAFEGDLSGSDGEHALGGMHAVVWEDSGLAGHAAALLDALERLVRGAHGLGRRPPPTEPAPSAPRAAGGPGAAPPRH